MVNRIQILREILTALDKEQVNYCILRNYDFLSGQKKILSDSDRSLDVVIPKKDLKKFDMILNSKGFRYRKGYSLTHRSYCAIKNLEIMGFDTQIGAVHWNDMPYLDEKHLLKNRVKKDFFYTPCPDDEYVMLLVHSILGKRMFKKEYKERMLALASEINKHYIADRLREIFGKRNSEEILEFALDGKFDAILRKKNMLIFYFIKKSYRNVLTFIGLSFRWFYRRVFIKRLGLAPMIAILGPDGSGKSTMSKEINHFLKSNKRKVFLVYGGRGKGQILPIRKIGNKYKSAERKRDRLSKPKSTFFRRLLYYPASIIFTLDLLLRYWLIILPKRLIGYIIISDRYSSDILLMDNISFSYKKFLLWFFPRPKIKILLYNTPEVLHKRRPEESLEGLKNQLRLFNTQACSLKIKTIDKKADTEKVISFIMDKLLSDWY